MALKNSSAGKNHNFNSMINFDTIEYLKNGNPKQMKVFEILTKHSILSRITEFNPILTGTIPINIDIENSDLDIICYWTNKIDFIKKIKDDFGNELHFRLHEIEIHFTPTVIANFLIDGFEIEIFGQNIPVQEQNAYRHMIIEHQILLAKGEKFRKKIVQLKQNGYKTELAFGVLLGLNEDPYLELLEYQI